jgi:hypothetical protein
MTDILSRIANAPAPTRKSRTYMAYQIMYSGRASRKLYTSKRAAEICARARRMGLDFYTVKFGKISL